MNNTWEIFERNNKNHSGANNFDHNCMGKLMFIKL